MTAELAQLSSNPLAAIEIAVGPPAPELTPQNPDNGIKFDRIYSSDVTRFVLKKARFSRDDIRIFDTDGELVLVSHHPGKNPYEALDPFGVTPLEDIYSWGGEWESITDITSYRNDLSDFEVRPKTLTIKGRQFVQRNGQKYLNVAKLGKLKTLSIRPTFGVFIADGPEMLYKVTADLTGRTMSFTTPSGDQVAVMAKTKSALIKNAIFGNGMESTIDIAPGVDVSVILASIFGIMNVGNSLIKDAASNFLFDPIKDEFTDNVMDIALGNEEENDLLQFLNEEVNFGEFDLSGLGDEIMDEEGAVLGAIGAASAAVLGGGEGEDGDEDFVETASGFLDCAGEACSCLCTAFFPQDE